MYYDTCPIKHRSY